MCIRDRIQKASKELQQAEEKSAKQYEDMKLRIKYMYEAGDTELEKFINAESAGDALNKAEYVQAVYTYDRDKLQEYVDTKKEIENLKTTLEKDKASLEKMNTELNVKKETLTTTIQTKQAEEQQVLAAAQAVAKKRQAEGKDVYKRQEYRTIYPLYDRENQINPCKICRDGRK